MFEFVIENGQEALQMNGTTIFCGGPIELALCGVALVFVLAITFSKKLRKMFF